MKEVYGNVWEYKADVVCIPTNGVFNNGRAVMGRGVAEQALIKYPKVATLLGDSLEQYGNHLTPLFADLVAFPTKHHWREQADLDLIKQSATELSAFVDPELTYVLPRPGCGNGRLSWEQVKPAIEDILPDNVHVIELEEAA